MDSTNCDFTLVEPARVVSSRFFQRSRPSFLIHGSSLLDVQLTIQRRQVKRPSLSVEHAMIQQLKNVWIERDKIWSFFFTNAFILSLKLQLKNSR